MSELPATDAPAPGLKNALTVVAAAKIALLNDIKKRAAGKDLANPQISHALTVADGLIAKQAGGIKVGDMVPESHLFGLLKTNWIVVAVIDMAVKKQKAADAEKTKQLQNKTGHALQPYKPNTELSASHQDEHESPEIEDNAEADESHEHEIDEEGPEFDHEDGSEFEQEHDEIDPHAVDLHDLKDVAHDVEAMKNIDITEWQHELMNDIKALPSIGDQAAMMFVVSQISPGNMGFRNEGAAHLMQNAANGLLGVEDKMLAFAGAEALRDPNSSLFAAKTPSTLDPSAIGEIPEMALSADFAPSLSTPHSDFEQDLAEMAAEHGHKDHAPAPFSLIDHAGGHVEQDLSSFAHDPRKLLMAQFNANELMNERLDVAPEQEQTAWQQPQKTKALFDIPKFEPSPSFYKDVAGLS